MSCLPKPVLRGHIKRRGIKGLIGAIVFAGVNSTLFHFLYAVPRKEAYEEFLKTYDAEAHFKDLMKWNYLQFAEALKEAASGGA